MQQTLPVPVPEAEKKKKSPITSEQAKLIEGCYEYSSQQTAQKQKNLGG